VNFAELNIVLSSIEVVTIGKKQKETKSKHNKA
jgi:hypothetical protein